MFVNDVLLDFVVEVWGSVMIVFERLFSHFTFDVAAVFYAACGGYLIYMVYLLYQPLNRIRGLSDVGFGQMKRINGRGLSPRDLAREVLRRRRIGDLPPVFPNGWFCLMESRNLKPGCVVPVSALGENFAVFRSTSDDEKTYILDAYCPHLGANLAIGGQVHGDCLKCPFHGWSFRGHNGNCTVIPYSDKVPEFARIKSWPCKEVNGAIYVWYHAEGTDPYWEPIEIKEVTGNKWVYRGRSEHHVATHIQDIPENGSDVSHLAELHQPSLLNGSELQNTKCWLLDWASHVWDANWKAGDPPDSHTTNISLVHSIRIFGKFTVLTMNVHVQQIGPGIVHLHFNTPFGKAILFHKVLPLEPLLQKVVHYLYCEPTMPHFYSKLILYGESIMVERDICVWNHKTFMGKPLLVKEDKFIPKFRRWYSQFYSENSPKFTSRKETLDW